MNHHQKPSSCTPGREIYLFSPIDPLSANIIVDQILYYNEENKNIKRSKVKPMKLYINSPGGCVYSTLSIINAIKTSKIPIKAHVVGEACSGAFYIAISCHKRIIYQDAKMMLHSLGSESFGKIEEMQERQNELKILQKQLDSIILKNTNLTKDIVNDINVRKLDKWFTPKECIKYGICDKIKNTDKIFKKTKALVTKSKIINHKEKEKINGKQE